MKTGLSGPFRKPPESFLQPAQAQEYVNGGGKAVAALQRSDVSGQMVHMIGKGDDVRHAAGHGLSLIHI